jgi:DNA-binding MarR family transcriptional regulator
MAEPDDETLAEAFWSVARRLRHGTHETVAPFGITPGQARALGVLRRHGGMRISALSERLRIAARSATEVVDALEERGLVARSPDPQDRRATVVTLGPRGEAIARAVREARSTEATAFFSKLSETDRTDLARILGLLRSS